VIVLTDPTCPYCVKLHGEIRKAAAKDADVAFFVMPYPRNRNDQATYQKCLAVVCSKSEKLLDDAYAGKEVPRPPARPTRWTQRCGSPTVKDPGTPTMILPDGRMVSGYMETEALLALLK